MEKKKNKDITHKNLVEHLRKTNNKIRHKADDDIVIMDVKGDEVWFGIVGFRGWFKTDVKNW